MRSFSFLLGAVATPAIFSVKSRLSVGRPRDQSNAGDGLGGHIELEKNEDPVAISASSEPIEPNSNSNYDKGDSWAYLKSTVFLSVVCTLCSLFLSWWWRRVE